MCARKELKFTDAYKIFKKNPNKFQMTACIRKRSIVYYKSMCKKGRHAL